jgi:type II secretory pathway component HofQ
LVLFIFLFFFTGASLAGQDTKPPAQAAPPAADTAKKTEGTAEPAKDATTPEKAKEEAKEVAKEEAKEEEQVAVEPGNVTVNFKGADIKTVLAYISEVAGVDIVPAPDVKGIVDLKLTNKPWKVALDIIVRNYGFAYERGGYHKGHHHRQDEAGGTGLTGIHP